MPKKSKKSELIKFLKNAEKEYSISEIELKTSLAHPTVSKWVQKLEEEGKVETRETYGTTKLVKWKEEEVNIKQ